MQAGPRTGVAVEERVPATDAQSPPPVLLTVPQAAAMLGIGRTTAYELISAGNLEVVHIGRSTRVPVDAVHDLVAQLRHGDR